MVSTLQVALNLYLPGPPRKMHLKKCIFTFSENVTCNYALIVGVQNVNEERKIFVLVFLCKGKGLVLCVCKLVSVAGINGEIYSCEVHLKSLLSAPLLGDFWGCALFSKTIMSNLVTHSPGIRSIGITKVLSFSAVLTSSTGKLLLAWFYLMDHN